MECEKDGCRQWAEFYNPYREALCSDCIQVDVETLEYTWDECEAIPDTDELAFMDGNTP